METRYRRPVPPDAELRIRGRVTAQRGRRIEVESSIETPEGERLVEATAVFMRLPETEEARIAHLLGWDAL